MSALSLPMSFDMHVYVSWMSPLNTGREFACGHMCDTCNTNVYEARMLSDAVYVNPDGGSVYQKEIPML